MYPRGGALCHDELCPTILAATPWLALAAVNPENGKSLMGQALAGIFKISIKQTIDRENR
jgi:hypothetical protein